MTSSRLKLNSPTLHPRIAVLLGVNASWHIPLLVARAVSTVPAAWWGLRCAFTFLGDLLWSDDMGLPGAAWSVEMRFRVTEVFLAILWVRRVLCRNCIHFGHLGGFASISRRLIGPKS